MNQIQQPQVTPQPIQHPQVTPQPIQQPQVTPQPIQQPQVTPQPSETFGQVNSQSSSNSSNPYQSIIDQQNAQIQALIDQNSALNEQVTRMVQGGAQFQQQQQPQQFQQQPQQFVGQGWAMQPVQMPSAQDSQDWSLEALGKEIGKPRKE